LALDIGVRKKPSDERGPKLTSETKQPHSTMRAGTRQVIVDVTAAADGDGTEDEDVLMTKSLPTVAPSVGAVALNLLPTRTPARRPASCSRGTCRAHMYGC